MGTTHWRSNLAGLAGSETITGFDKVQADDVVCGTLTATKITVNSGLSAANITSTNYIKCGTTFGIFWGSLNTGASVAAAARAVIATPASTKGSLYMSNKGKVFKVLTSKTASSLDSTD